MISNRFRQYVNLNMSFLGIQFVFSLSSGHISRVLQNHDVQVEKLPLFWMMAPVIGLILQPVIGHYADATWSRFGRRKPYIFVGMVLTALSLIIIPNAHYFFEWIPAHILLGFLILLLYGAINLTMDPSKALLADSLRDSEANDGFSVQTFITGIGSVIGSAFPFLLSYFLFRYSQSSTTAQVSMAFYWAAFFLFFSVCWTLFYSKEKPFETEIKRKSLWKSFQGYWVAIPKVMRKLAWIQFFSWFAFFNMWVFATPGIANYFYGQMDSQSVSYNEAADWVGVLFAVYSGFSAIYALCIPKIASTIGNVFTYAISLFMGGLGFVSMFFFRDAQWLVFSMLGVGMAWGSILTLPYSILLKHIPKNNMGAYMGVFNVFITLPQLVSGLIGGWILVHLFNNNVMYMLYLSAACLGIAGLLVLLILSRIDSRNMIEN